MSQIRSSVGVSFDLQIPVLIIGAGACGLTAALAARDAGAEVLILERDATPTGSTSLSSGFIPAAATRFQQQINVDDTAEMLVADLKHKTHGRVDPGFANTVASASGPAIEWLADAHGLEWIVLDDFLYPGHSRHRMHAVPEKTGAALQARLLAAAETAGVNIATRSPVTALFSRGDGTIQGVEVTREDGAVETIGCQCLILACCGYGGDAELVRHHIPDMADALYFGHSGNTGDALKWGEALGAAVGDLTGYQGHGSVAHPHGVLMTWALMMDGGFQVNRDGDRFSNEHEGYSEQAVNVLAQPDKVAWDIYDQRVHELGMTFPDYVDAHKMGAVRSASSVSELAEICGLPPRALEDTFSQIEDHRAGQSDCPFGRDFSGDQKFAGPYYAAKVTGALFHTQGGLMVNEEARVLRTDRSAFPNLFAGGGAAQGVSGPDVAGYLSGNGLLSAVTLGYLAGQHAGRQASR